MIEQMDNTSAPSSRERAQRLYDQIVELETKRRRSAQARIPSDPNTWQQMRENYEAIILEDNSFSEQHNIEYALWQLHYRRIEELRAHFNAALSSAGSNTIQGVKGPARPDRITKIRLQFKTFLSEATGFYHDLIVKISAKYGLPLGHFSEDSDNLAMEKDGKKSSEVKKGLISCHRSLIYLGDLARYKGLYGEGDSRSREYAAASSYYLQAASLLPSSGNPHHQLAILASYSGDELLAIYRYFRSLAVDSPFSTARENLIVAFDKNRLSYSRLSGNLMVSTVKESPVRLTGRGRGKAEPKTASKDNNTGGSLVKEKTLNITEYLKVFCTRFIRLNGILFTRTSLETFAEVLSLVSSGLRELLSSGPEEELNFGADAIENGLLVVRLVSILIFTVHNVNRESEGQTYAEILQRTVLLQNAFTAVFELMGHILERCLQLHDPSPSFLLSGILVFVEWLACCPDVAAGSDVDDKQASVRSKFWNLCISFLNKLLSVGLMPIDDDEDETCFYNMSRYEEGETENRMALWEDFELRGFLPLLPAQSILDFSRKRSFGNDGQKEKRARARRILAAGKALANIVQVDKKAICFDSRGKKFVIGVEPQLLDNFAPTCSDMPHVDVTMQENHREQTNFVVSQTKQQPYSEGEEEDEVIVFKPIVAEKRTDAVGTNGAAYEAPKTGHNAPSHDVKLNVTSMLAPVNNASHLPAFDVHPQASVSISNTAQHFQTIQSNGSNWLAEEALLANNMRGLRLMGNGHVLKSDLQDDNHLLFSAPTNQSVDVGRSGMFYSHTTTPEAQIASKADISVFSRSVASSSNVSTSSTLSTGLQKNLVSRPARHLGPPPGFSSVPPKQVNESMSSSDLVTGNPTVDDYSWLDGYQVPPAMKGFNWLNGHQVQFSNIGSGLNIPITHTSYSNPNQITNSNGLSATVNFPFPGKQVPSSMQSQLNNQEGWQNYSNLDNVKLHQEQQIMQQQQLLNGSQNFNPLPDQYQGQSPWTGRYVV